MNVFDLRDSIVNDYSSFIRGFINIRDRKIVEKVDGYLNSGALWPQPILQLNPTYASGKSVEELVDEKLLHPGCEAIFRANKTEEGGGDPMRLYMHQTEAIRAARRGESYALTTGTGSGKSLGYIVPIVDYVLRVGSGNGIQAIIVYPMNALANSQLGELDKFFIDMKDNPPVTYRRYTGQDSADFRQKILENPPDILLTNYVMLELILTRLEERKLIRGMQGLRFLVLDELHTYRGRQGADVAMLTRRVREASQSDDLICVGASATLDSGSSLLEGRKNVANLASRIFGAHFKPENIIDETLSPETQERDFTGDNLRKLREELEPFFECDDLEGIRARLREKNGGKDLYEILKESLFFSWLERAFGIEREGETGKYIRRSPRPIDGKNGGALELQALVGEIDDAVQVAQCAKAIKSAFLLGYETQKPDSKRRFFSFRLHQFISRADCVYATAELGEDREIFMRKQRTSPGSEGAKILFPLVFCRSCGHEFYSVTRYSSDEGDVLFEPREPYDTDVLDEVEKDDVGYLYVNAEKPWPDEPDVDELPEMWKKVDDNGVASINRSKPLPENYRVNPKGEEVEASEPGVKASFVHSPFRFCPWCHVSFEPKTTQNLKSDFSNLGGLASEGRTTATTTLALSAVRHVSKMEELPPEGRKVLSFTDNRQDASFQAGHLNDFVDVAALRGALCHTLKEAGKEGLNDDKVAEEVVKRLNLDYEEYARNPKAKKGTMPDATRNALINVTGYRIHRDLKRGWRLVIPNLEQTALVNFEYAGLDDLAEDKEEWYGAMRLMSPEKRKEILLVFLDMLRRELAINYEWLQYSNQESLRRDSVRYLLPPWGFNDTTTVDDMQHAKVLYLRPRDKKTRIGELETELNITGGTLFGSYIRRELVDVTPDRTKVEHREEVIANIVDACVHHGLLLGQAGNQDDNGYQLNTASLIWKPGDGKTRRRDQIRQPDASIEGEAINEYFKEYYPSLALEMKDMYAREHTAQISYEEREEREQMFRDGTLRILFCSPTMELGVDISELNVVHMRNIPPTPANYAQRSGRAGRKGQPALVLTYATSEQQHDRYFFQRPELMVCGAVKPPQIDLTNETLIRAHLHSIWMTEASKANMLVLGGSLNKVMDTDDSENKMRPDCPVYQRVLDVLDDEGLQKAAYRSAQSVLKSIEGELKETSWYDDEWVKNVFRGIRDSFESACKRWRQAYQDAKCQRESQSGAMADEEINFKRNTIEWSLRNSAEIQLSLLLNTGSGANSDFYPYRYFASEQFLPGYNFPALPVTAFLETTRGRDREKKGDYLSRPRFLAISEFGPKAIVYHNGERYVVKRASMSASPNEQDGGYAFESAKVCAKCGYFHEIKGMSNPDVCENCGEYLTDTMANLFKINNVTATLHNRITCNEDKRMRFSYAVRPAFRFATRGDQKSSVVAKIFVPGDDGKEMEWGAIEYGDAASIYFVNNGLRRNKQQDGFLLDPLTGSWRSKNSEDDPDGKVDKLAQRVKCVYARPYVKDVKNSLLLSPDASNVDLSLEQTASLQAALCRAIQLVFSVEDRELAAFPLPDEDERDGILFYEASEGGAGVLKNVFKEGTFRETIREALKLCHFDPDTREDLGHAEHTSEICDSACYDCLLNYSNQHDHPILDRHSIRDVLFALLDARLEVSSGPDHLETLMKKLKAKKGSDFEVRWLRFINERELRLPSDAQYEVKIGDSVTKPDFAYLQNQMKVAIYIDGKPHEYDDVQDTDERQTRALRKRGWQVVRFGNDPSKWEEVLEANKSVFYFE